MMERDYCDEYTWARFADAYERPWPEDHPRCEECDKHLTEEEISDSKPSTYTPGADWSYICDDCGVVCDSCGTKVWFEYVALSVENVRRGRPNEQVTCICDECITELDDEEIEELKAYRHPVSAVRESAEKAV
tara:strand:+ start:14945 stop:15343 length:399 start_codon:yes stop_codon:yes gene_type:complete